MLWFNIISLALHAQSHVITGFVKSEDKPLSEVTVSQKGTNISAITNKDGFFQLMVSSNNPILLFHHPEFDDKTFSPGILTSISISLTPKFKSIDEIILNAGYYNVKDKERTGNIAKLTAKSLEYKPITNVLSTVQGRLSGVSITQNSGSPGGGFEVQIRGKNSLRPDGSYPLFVVDGVPLNSQSNSISSLSSAILSKGEASPLNAINPNDIESIEFLKDADATAIYGSRGANGVVLITTKKGKNQKLSAELLLNTSISKTNKFIDFLNTEQYLQMRKDAFKYDNVSTYPSTAYDVNGKWSSDKYTNWYDELIGKPYLTMQQQLSLSSGNAQTQWFLSVNNLSQDTPFGYDFNYKRKGVNFNMNHISQDKKFSISPSFYYTVQNNNLIERDLTTQIVLSPNAPNLYNEDGTVNWENNTFDNPIAKLENEFKSKISTLSAQISAEYKFLPSLSLKINSGFSQTLQKETKSNPSTAYNPSLNLTSANSTIYLANVQRENWIVEPQLNWSKNWDKHTLNALIGTTLEQKDDKILRLQGSDFPSNDLIYNLANAKVLKVNEDTKIQYRYLAFYSRFNYAYDGKYLLNLTARRDGSSRFGPNNRFATFGAIGAAWVFSKENFAKDTFINFGKIRASLGTAGSDLIGDYQYLDTYTTGSLIYDGVVGMFPSRLFNPNFSWEKTTKLETAIEIGAFKDKINLSLSWYRNRSSNQLVGIPLAATTGFLTMQSNFPAKVQNSGVETEISAKIIKKNQWNWLVSANLTLPSTKLLQFDNISQSAYASTYVVGESMNIKKVYQFQGVDANTGIYTFTDFNGDGKIDSNDKQKIVKYGVNYFGGFSSQLRYKNVSLDFLIQWVNQRQYSPDYFMSVLGIMRNVPTYMLDYWTPDNTDARYQRPTNGGNSAAISAFSRYTSSDAVIVDASFIRLNNLQLSYTIPFNNKSIHSLLLIAQGQNLITITKYKGLDPETLGLYLPTIKTYSFSAIIKF